MPFWALDIWSLWYQEYEGEGWSNHKGDEGKNISTLEGNRGDNIIKHAILDTSVSDPLHFYVDPDPTPDPI